MARQAVWLVLAAGLAGCSIAAPAPPRAAGSIAPPPPGWFAFCALHGSPDQCDRVPAATAMADGKAVTPPRGWHGYCRRHPADPACAA